MKKIVIVIQVITIIILMNLTCLNEPKVVSKEIEWYWMTSTGYSRHPSCITDEYNDGFTATMTPIREGICAINVDYINEKWVVRSPLKLGQKIYIEGMGEYSVEDTGPFTEKNFHFDFWNLDIFYDKDKNAKEHGIKRIKVIVIKEG